LTNFEQLKKVYDKFVHLDKVLNDVDMLSNVDSFRLILKECWNTIKNIIESNTMEKCQNCRHWQALYSTSEYGECEKIVNELLFHLQNRNGARPENCKVKSCETPREFYCPKWEA